MMLNYGHNEMEESVNGQVEAFKKMTNLRFIQLIYNFSSIEWCFSSSNDDMMSSFSLKRLRYLEWEYFPFKCLDNIDMCNVVVIKLQKSKLEILWEGFKSLKKLRILDVRYSNSLTKTGNFVGLENLEELCLYMCENLEYLHTSIGCLRKLEKLNLSYCKRLKGLTSLVQLNLENCPNISNLTIERVPDSLAQLNELKKIHLSSCTNLKSIPNLPTNIETVEARDCISLVNLPSNMSELQFLSILYLDGCLELESEGFMKVTGLRNLHRLSMRNCNVSQVPSEIGNLVSLKYLNLSENSFSNLPDSFSNLSKLVELKINDCSNLQLLPVLPSNLTTIEASKCCSLDAIPYESMEGAYIFRSKMLEESFFTQPLWMSLSGDEVPEWCSYTSNEDALSFMAPPMQQHLDNKICGVILCATAYNHLFHKLSPTMQNKTKETSRAFHAVYFEGGPMFVIFCPLNDTTLVVEAGDTVVIEFHKYSHVSSCGMRLIYEGDVVDSELCIQTPFTFTVPLEMTDDDDDDDDDDDASTTQLYDDSVFSLPFHDNGYLESIFS